MTPPSGSSRWSALAATAIGLSLLGATSSVWAGAPTDALRDFFGAVNIVLSDPATEPQPFERLRLIRRHVNDAFDFREAAKLALGREWGARTPKEQNEFVAMFADLLERSFVWRLASKASLGGGGVKVRYLDERVTGDVATVNTQLAARDGNEIPLEYRLVHRSGRWVVCDVVMDGVSTMQNYHAQFQRIVRESSYAQLASQLRAKLGLSAVGAQATPIPIAAAAPPVPPTMPSGSRETAGPIDLERQAIARDVAAVVTPGLVVSDVAARPTPRPPLASSAPVEPARGSVAEPSVAPAPSPVRAAAPPPPVGPVPATSAAIVPPSPAPLSPTPTTAAPTAVPPPAVVAPAKLPAPRATGTAPRHPAAPSGFWVQVGAYRDTATAGRIAKQVDGEILIVADASDAVARAAETPLLRVRVGPFVERTQAVSKARDLQALGYKPFIAVGH